MTCASLTPFQADLWNFALMLAAWAPSVALAVLVVNRLSGPDLRPWSDNRARMKSAMGLTAGMIVFGVVLTLILTAMKDLPCPDTQSLELGLAVLDLA